MTDDELYDNMVREEQSGQLAQSAILSHNTDPDKYAANRNEVRSLGLPVSVAKPAKKPTSVNNMTNTVNNFNSLLERSPRTATFLITPEYAKLTHDDTENLSAWEDFFKPVIHTAASMVQMPISGLSATAKLITSKGDLSAASQVLEENQRILDETYLTTDKSREVSGFISKAMLPFQMAGRGWAGLAELPTGGLAGAEQVVAGTDAGSNIMVPVMGTIGEASAMFGLGEGLKVAKARAEIISKALEKSKVIKVNKRDPEVAREFFKTASQDAAPVKMPVEKFDEILADTRKTPDELLDNPEQYYDAKFRGEDVEIPVSDLAAMADNIKPEHVNEMKVGEFPSVSEMEMKIEDAKAKEAQDGLQGTKETGAEAGRGQEVLTGEEGGTSLQLPPYDELYGSEITVYHGGQPNDGWLRTGQDTLSTISFFSDLETAKQWAKGKGEQIYSTKLNVGDVWDYRNIADAEMLAKYLVEKDSSLNYASELEAIKQGRAVPIERDLQFLRDKGYSTYTTNEMGSDAIHTLNKSAVKVEPISTPSPDAKLQPQGEFGSRGGESAVEAGSLAFGMELPKYAGNVNLERINADYSVKKLILDTADRYKGKIDEARRGKITDEEVTALAKELGMTVDDLLSRKKGEAYNAEQTKASRDILNTSATRLRQIQEAAARIGSNEALLEFRKALDLHAAIQAEVAGASAEAGRALSAHRIASQPSRNYKAMLDALGGRELNEGILKRFSEVDTANIAEVNKFIKEFAKVKKASMIYEAWISFLLSGLKTHVVNTVSNVLTFATKPVETTLVAGMEAIKTRPKGVPRERFTGEAIQELVGAKAGIKDGVAAALKAWREELPADTLVKFDSPSPYGGAIPGKTGKFIRGPLRALSAADEFMKSVVYTGELYGQAFRQARIEGLKGEALNNRMAEIITNPSDKLRELAKHEAEYRTFNQPLGPYSKKINALRDLPGAKVIVPFFRTLTNIAKFGLERTPLNFGRLIYKIKKGELKGAEISDELAKPILGTLIAAAVVELASEGMITGGGPKDKNARATLFRTGWQPYSVKIGDKYIPYGRFEPMGTVFGMSADFVELADSGADEKELSDYAEAISLSFSKNLLSKTFVMGVSNALDAVQDPKRYGEQWINAMAGSLVPSISANIVQAMDPNVRVTDNPLERIQSRLPFLSEALTPKRDVWGREILRHGNALERGLSPAPISTDTGDPVDAEIARLGMNIGMPSKRFTVDGEKVEMSPLQYDEYVKRTGERAYDEIYGMIDMALDDEEKKDMIESIVRKIRAEERKIMIEEISQGGE